MYCTYILQGKGRYKYKYRQSKIPLKNPNQVPYIINIVNILTDMVQGGISIKLFIYVFTDQLLRQKIDRIKVTGI